MFLLEYIIKLLMSHSETLFMGLIIVLLGYYGWLLWNIHHNVLELSEMNIKRSDKNSRKTEEILNNLEGIDDILFSDIHKIINDNNVYLKKIYSRTGDFKNEFAKTRSQIIAEVKEESEEVREIVKIISGRSSPCYFPVKNKKEDDED